MQKLQIKIFHENDTLIMKKNHACDKSATAFTVLRTGSDVRIVCNNCKRDVTVSRIKLEKNIKSVIPSSESTKIN